MARVTELRVNDQCLPVNADPERSLLSVLREDLDLVGAKYGCGEGQCGACTVLVEGQPVQSCIFPAGSAAGKAITTIEGLSQDGRLHPLQEAFLEADALQCGYCTPGMIMAGIGLLAQNPDPTEAEIVRHMEGNLCRCGAYARVITAIRRTAAAGTRSLK